MKAIKVSPARNIATNWFNPFRLLLAAAIFHLLVTTIVFGIGRGRILPGTFYTNGIAVSFAPDGVGYREDAIILEDFLRKAKFADWFAASDPQHVKLYSVFFAVFGGLFGYNILSAEKRYGLTQSAFQLANEEADLIIVGAQICMRAGSVGPGVYILMSKQLLTSKYRCRGRAGPGR